ncbi:flagellin [Magnetovibrio sp. PR-2]|uniref:flagellin n=1 Tax=Magnetovibrio sp. PR-2 TaxID=3120356 RepID=UPI002FCE2CFA
MADVTLSAAVRGSLLSLQSTTDLIERTQSRLSTGLKVSSAIDDPVAFFQAKTLTDRASDFTEKKDNIDQGISSLSAAVDGIEAVENLVNQLKGIANSMKSATGTQFTDLITQFNDLRSQIDLLTTDSTYQGVNLINGTGQTLSVEFSDKSTSKLSVSSVDVTANGMDVNSATNITALGTNVLAVNHADFVSATTLTGGDTVSLTYVGPDVTVTTAANKTMTYGTATLTLAMSAGGSATLTQGTTYTVTIRATTAAGGGAAAGVVTSTTFSAQMSGASAGGAGATVAAGTAGKTYVGESNSTSIDAAITDLSSALTTLRTEASSLGNNVALLQTRLEFTEAYVSTLDEGGSKLTLADINEEGANLLALQTRQQLGIQSLSFAGQAEQSVLGLFR